MKNRNIEIGEFYIHFKYEINTDLSIRITQYMYKIINIAINASDNVNNVDTFVIYKNIASGKVYARDIKEFLSVVDKNKYPNIKQKYRFTKCDVFGKIIDEE